MFDLEKLLSVINEEGWTVEQDSETIDLGKFSPAGHDFHISIEKNCIQDNYDFVEAIKEIYDGYDVSYETYLWLDDTGHGQNGACYDMKDLYEDFEACEKNILMLVTTLEGYIEDMEQEEEENEEY